MSGTALLDPEAIRRKATALIGQFGHSNDNVALGAARGLGRLMKAHNLTPADIVSTTPSLEHQRDADAAVYAAWGRAQRIGAASDNPADAARLMLHSDMTLNDWERQFLRDMTERRGGRHARLSVKQAAAIDRISALSAGGR